MELEKTVVNTWQLERAKDTTRREVYPEGFSSQRGYQSTEGREEEGRDRGLGPHQIVQTDIKLEPWTLYQVY